MQITTTTMLPADDMDMLGLRDLVFIAPTPSMHQNHISADHHPNLLIPSLATLGVGLGIFPLFTATTCITPQSNGFQDSGNSNNPNCWSLKKGQEMSSSNKDGHNVENNDPEQMVKSSGSGMKVCRDCGNKAKKDCSYRRCRSCCKSHGYDCDTHVRSTWVPAARRREQRMSAVGDDDGDGSSGSSSGVKRPRIEVSPPNVTTTSHTSTSNATTPRITGISSSHQDTAFKNSLPRLVRAPAVFRCHRVTAVGNGEAEFVYQATVSISGHVFKGFLYDQGVDEKNASPCISQMHLESSSGGRNRESSSPIVAPSNPHPD